MTAKSEEPSAIGGHPAMRRLMQNLVARKAWEAANPALAAAWTDALRDDATWAEAREQAKRVARLEVDAPFQMGKLGVPQRAALALRAVDVARPGVRAVLAHVVERRALLALLGGVGTGKTVAAAFLLRQRLVEATKAAGVPMREVAMWVSSVELASLSSFTESDRVWFERMQECAFLVLDDFGVEDLHAHAVQRLERLIDVRYGNNRETVLTSNCGVEGFARRVGERIADRFREAGRIVECGKESMRRKS